MRKCLSFRCLPLVAVLPRLGIALFLGVSFSILLTSFLVIASSQNDQAGANIAGLLDSSFGTGGVVTTCIGPDDDWAYAVALQKDGKIVVVGEADDGAGHYDFAIARYTVSGTLDTSFGTAGIVTNSVGLYDHANDVAIQEDGKILVVGTANSNFVLMRYTVSGTLDTSFGTGGVVITSFSFADSARSVAVQEDGKIVVAGRAYGSCYDFAVARYAVSGTLDASFGTGGVVITPIGPCNDEIRDLAIQEDGKIVVAGYADNGSYANDFAVARYTISGTLDTSFGVSGVVTTPVNPDADDEANSISIQKDGKIVVAGLSGNFTLIRYTISGALDADFGVGGIVTTSVGTNLSFAEGIAVQEDGRIVVVGGGDNGGDGGFAVVRYIASGVLDSSFGTGGIVLTDIGPDDDFAYDVAIQGDGRIVVAGIADNGSDDDFAVARYHGTAPYSIFLPLVIKN